MAAISRRPRLTLAAALAISLGLAACSLLKQDQVPEDKVVQAQRDAQGGKHADAAQRYAELAAEQPGDRDNYLLLSAEQWVGAGNIAAAKQSFAQVSPAARTHLAIPRALVAAEIAYAENDGARAINELDQIPVPTSADQAQNYWWLKGRSAYTTGHPVRGTRSLVERERWLADPNALRANRQEIYNRVRAAAEHGQSLKSQPKSDPIVAGWLDLGPVAAALARDPVRGAGALAAWKRQYPQHEANETLGIATGAAQAGIAPEFPDQIALLLPLTGRAEAFGVAVRDGFVAAYLEQDPTRRPRLKIYDVTAETVAGAYQHALSDGAGFVVGPLTKEDVAAVVPLDTGRTPMLALNFLADTISPPRSFYQFALLPEDEARMVARRVVADGHPNGVALVPAGDWGNRVAAAFSDELSRLGGTLLDSQRYDTVQADFADAIKQVMQLRGGKGEPVTHRTDAGFIFVAGTPGAARQILPQLKFHYVGDVPVYSTSDSYEPDPSANTDLDGLMFPDMPWMVGNDPATAQIRDAIRGAWPARTTRRDRLYAFGFDAYRLLPGLRSKSPAEGTDIAGVSGKLHLDDHNRIRRDLEWAQIRGGVASAL